MRTFLPRSGLARRPLAALALVLGVACDDPVRPMAPTPPVSTSRAFGGSPFRVDALATIDFGRFGGWEPVLDGTFDSGPAISEGLILARGTDLRLYATSWGWDATARTSLYAPWQAIGDGLTSRPAVTTISIPRKCSPGAKDCPPPLLTHAIAARREDGNIWVMTRRISVDAWTPWQRLPAGVFGAPAIAYAHPYVYVVARARDGTLHWTRNSGFDPDGVIVSAWWSPWQPVPGGAVSTDPAALGTPRIPASPFGTLHLLAVRSDGRVWRNRMEDRGTFVYSGWTPIPGGTTAHAPAISGVPAYRMDVAVRGPDDAVWVTSSEDGGATWTPYRSIGGAVTSPPAVWSNGGEAVHVLARGLDLRTWHNYTRP